MRIATVTALVVLVIVSFLLAQGGGGLPERIRQLQSDDAVRPPTMEKAVEIALAAARDVALPLIDAEFHRGRRIVVPDDHRTIQSAIDAAKSGDIVVVKAGIYFEQLVMKDGVKLISDESDDGNALVAVEGARLKLPRRALRTILDGSKAKPSRHGMIDFNPGVGRKTIVDGFTIRNLPRQDHHVPGHAHGLNVRGASPVIMNCHLHGNGSTGIGNHVVYRDQAAPMAERDFRFANVKHKAEAVIYHNVIRDSFGLGIGCNHFSAPLVLGNEVFANSDAELGAEPTPGIGAKHGARPTTIGNLVHDNPGGGILCRVGVAQGAHPVDRRARPVVERNVVYRNGADRPAISCSGGGTAETPVRFVGNVVFDAGQSGIGLSDGSVGVIEDNLVSGSKGAGIAVHGASALRLNGNRVTGASGPGIVLVAGARILEMKGNAGPDYMVRGAKFGETSGESNK